MVFCGLQFYYSSAEIFWFSVILDIHWFVDRISHPMMDTQGPRSLTENYIFRHRPPSSICPINQELVLGNSRLTLCTTGWSNKRYKIRPKNTHISEWPIFRCINNFGFVPIFYHFRIFFDYWMKMKRWLDIFRHF